MNHIFDICWKDSDGTPPPPLTVITAVEVRSGKWTPSSPDTLVHLDELESSNPVWPDHCLFGDEEGE